MNYREQQGDVITAAYIIGDIVAHLNSTRCHFYVFTLFSTQYLTATIFSSLRFCIPHISGIIITVGSR